MNELERFEKLKKLGYVYEPETGLVKRNGEVRGFRRKTGYIVLNIRIGKKNPVVLAHRFIWWIIYNEIPHFIDHINQIRFDNRICNLRNVNNQKNQFNRKAKGYSFTQHAKKYRAQIMLNGKNHFLGYYEKEQEARQAYLEAKKTYHII